MARLMNAHGHSHTGHQHHDDGFDWDAMAERLELDAAITEPIVGHVIAEIGTAFTHVLDVGCGPGSVAATLAELQPHAVVTALDSSVPLLHRARHRAHELGLAERMHFVEGDLESSLPDTPPADLVWASMVLHHVTDPVATLRALHDRLQRGGTLVMVEFGAPPAVLPAGDALLTSGTWARFQDATSAVLNERLGLDPVAIDWPAHLGAAGFADILDTRRHAVHPSPLSDTARAWLEPHVVRGIEMAFDRLDPDDVAALEAFAATVADRDDLAITAERRVLVAHRR